MKTTEGAYATHETRNGALCTDISTLSPIYKRGPRNEYHACMFGSFTNPRVEWVHETNVRERRL